MHLPGRTLSSAYTENLAQNNRVCVVDAEFAEVSDVDQIGDDAFVVTGIAGHVVWSWPGRRHPWPDLLS